VQTPLLYSFIEHQVLWSPRFIGDQTREAVVLLVTSFIGHQPAQMDAGRPICRAVSSCLGDQPGEIVSRRKTAIYCNSFAMNPGLKPEKLRNIAILNGY
jgi:hypothetical protein